MAETEQQFITLLTNVGKQKEIDCLAQVTTTFDMTTIVLGDANGSYYKPTKDQEAILNRVYEAPIDSIELIGDTYYATLNIPVDVGGFNIREIGVLDSERNLLIIQNCNQLYKSDGSDGEYKELTIRVDLSVLDSDVYPYFVHPNVNTASQEWVEHYYQPRREKGVADGYPPLDERTQIPIRFLPMEDLNNRMLHLVGYVSSTEPTGQIKEGDLWIEAAALPTTFPVDCKIYTDGAWVDTTYTPEIFDLWSNSNTSHGEYWFGNEWNLLDYNVDLTPYRRAVDEDAINATKVNKSDVSKGIIDLTSLLDGRTVTFPLTKDILEASYTVYLNGLAVYPGSFTLQANQITLDSDYLEDLVVGSHLWIQYLLISNLSN